MDDEVAIRVPMPVFFLHPILTKDFSLHKKLLHCIAMVLVFKYLGTQVESYK